MRCALPALACLLLAGQAWAVEGQLDELPSPPPREHKAAVAPAAAPAQPVAVEFSWDDYHSLVVVGDGVGMIRPAWVATYENAVIPSGLATLLAPVVGLFGYHGAPEQEKLAVAYRAQAWLDAQGRMHVEAKSAVLVGPQADNWSPDSFIFTLPTIVETVDDEERSNRGTVTRVVDPAKTPEQYRDLQTKAQVVVGDGI